MRKKWKERVREERVCEGGGVGGDGKRGGGGAEKRKEGEVYRGRVQEYMYICKAKSERQTHVGHGKEVRGGLPESS